MKIGKFIRRALVVLVLGAVLPIAGLGVVATVANAAPTYTATSTDGTVFTASSLNDAQIEAVVNNLVDAQQVSSGVVTFAGINLTACLQAGERGTGDYTAWNATASALHNCTFDPTTPTTIYCYKGSKLVSAVVGPNPVCPAGDRKGD